MTFESDRQRRAVMASLQQRGGGPVTRGRRSRLGVKPKGPSRLKIPPLMPLPELQKEMARYENRTVPVTLLKQLERHGSATLKKKGYTTGLERMRLPGGPGQLSREQAASAMRGQIAVALGRTTPIAGVQLRRNVSERIAYKQSRRARQLATGAAIGLGVATLPAGYLMMRTAAGRHLAARAVRGFHPLRPFARTTQDVQTVLNNAAEQRVRNISSGLTYHVNRKIDALFGRLTGIEGQPGLIDRADVRFKRIVRGTARRIGIPVSTQAGEGPAELVRRSDRVWQDLLKIGKAQGRFLVHSKKKIMDGREVLTGKPAFYTLNRVSPTVIRRRRVMLRKRRR